MENPFPFSDNEKRYHTWGYEMKKTFGCRVRRLSIDGAFSCPNRDGTKGSFGCAFCSPRGSGDFAPDREKSISGQLEEGLSRAALRPSFRETDRFIAYFQAFTNTYAPLSVLRQKYEEALAFPGVVGISISTRPDCLPPDVIDYLAVLHSRTFLLVELGLQSCRDETLIRIQRGHTAADFEKAYESLAKRNIRVCPHIIDGLPGEDREDMLETARFLAGLKPYALKIHLLHVLKRTEIEKEYKSGAFDCLSMDEYVGTVVSQLELLPPETVVCRLTGDGKKEDLIAPLWSENKIEVLNAIDREMLRRNTKQGARFVS